MRYSILTLVLAAFASAQVSNHVYPRMSGKWYAAAFAQWMARCSVPVLEPGVATIVLTPPRVILTAADTVPAAVAGTPIQINDGAASEIVTPTSVSCSATGCNATAVFAHSHLGSFTVSSANFGLNEAIAAAAAAGGNVVVGSDWHGNTAMILAAAGSPGVLVVDERGGQVTWYAWNGSTYGSELGLNAASGIQTRAPAITPTSIENVELANEFPAADAGMKVQAAMGALPAAGGSVDGRALTPGTMHGLAVDAGDRNWDLLLPPGQFTCSGGPCLAKGASNTGERFSVSAAGINATTLRGTGRDPVISFSDSNFSSLEGLTLDGAGTSGHVAELVSSTPGNTTSSGSRWGNFQIDGAGPGSVGLFLSSSCCNDFRHFKLENMAPVAASVGASLVNANTDDNWFSDGAVQNWGVGISNAESLVAGADLNASFLTFGENSEADIKAFVNGSAALDLDNFTEGSGTHLETVPGGSQALPGPVTTLGLKVNAVADAGGCVVKLGGPTPYLIVGAFFTQPSQEVCSTSSTPHGITFAGGSYAAAAPWNLGANADFTVLGATLAGNYVPFETDRSAVADRWLFYQDGATGLAGVSPTQFNMTFGGVASYGFHSDSLELATHAGTWLADSANGMLLVGRSEGTSDGTLVTATVNATTALQQNGAPVLISGANGLSAGTITLSGGIASHIFIQAYAAAPVCVATDQTSASAVKVVSTATAVSLSGTGTDIIAWQCVPEEN